MSNLIDIATVPVVDVWGEAARARRIEGERITLALLELAPDSVVPGHHHENEQLGMVITGSVTFTVGDETREIGPGGTWRIPSGTHHHVVSGPNGAIMVDVFSPIRSDWDTLPSNPATTPAWPPAT